MRLTDIQNDGRYVLFSVVTVAFITVAAGASGESGLDAYLGQDAERMIEALGEPGLRTPHELWYWNGPTVSGGHPGAPSPAVRNGRYGVAVDVAGGYYAQLSISNDFCNLVVKLSSNGQIDAIEKQGPGCFEFIHHLKEARIENRSRP